MLGQKPYDKMRTFNFMCYGLMINGPALHLTYGVFIPNYIKGNAMSFLAKKMLFT